MCTYAKHIFLFYLEKETYNTYNMCYQSRKIVFFCIFINEVITVKINKKR